MSELETKSGIRYTKPSDFFNTLGVDLLKLLIIPHEKQVNSLLEMYTFKDWPLTNIRIFKYIGLPVEDYNFMIKNKEMDMAVNHGCYHLGYEIFSSAEDNPIIMSMDQQDVAHDFFRILYKYDNQYALKLFDDYQKYLMDKVIEVDTLHDVYKEQTSRMYEYLVKNVNAPIYDIDYSKSVSDETAELIYEQIANNGFDIPSYNDMDYKPFIYDGRYVIFDISSQTLLVCDFKNEDNFTWYSFEVPSSENVTDQMQDIYYEANGMIGHAIKHELIEINKVLQYKMGKMVMLSGDVGFLHLLQNYIYGELIKGGKIVLSGIEMGMERLLMNYAVQNDYYKIMERSVGDFLNDLIYINGVLTYKDFNLVDEGVAKKLVRKEGDFFYISQHSDISVPKNIKAQHLLEIKEYVVKVLKENQSKKGIDGYFAYYTSILDTALLENNKENKKTNKLK